MIDEIGRIESLETNTESGIANTSTLISSNATIDTVVDAIKIITDALPDSGALTSLGTIQNQSFLLEEIKHTSYIFPENSADDVTMHTGAANTYGPYNVIKDGSNNTFSNKFNNTDGHLSGMLIEDASVADKVFIYEMSYGASHTTLFTYRFRSATNQIGCAMKPVVRPLIIPTGEELYYRGMCENASANALVSFRYHFH